MYPMKTSEKEEAGKESPLYSTAPLWSAFGLAKGNPLSPIGTKSGIADLSGRSHVTVNNVMSGVCADLNCIADVASALGCEVRIEIVPLPPGKAVAAA